MNKKDISGILNEFRNVKNEIAEEDGWLDRIG
jgi:hypothetical protein